MATPAGKRCKALTTAQGDQVHVYSDMTTAVLQLRRSVPTTDDLAAPSFKVGVVLNAEELLALAGELLTAAAVLVRASRGPATARPGKTPAGSAGVEG